MAQVTLLRRAAGKGHQQTVDEANDAVALSVIERTIAGAASLWTDALVTTITLGGGAAQGAITIGKSAVQTRILGPLRVDETIVGPSDGTGIVVGAAGSGALTASAIQLASFTTTERDTNLTAANGMLIYNGTTNLINLRINSEWSVVRQDYGASAGNPTGTPRDGDRYYDTGLDMEMRYDGTRAKWLSVNVGEWAFGRNGSTATGSGYRAINGMTMTNALGHRMPHNGTVVGIGYTRQNTAISTVEVRDDGVLLSTLGPSAATGAHDSSLNDNFASGSTLSVFNAAGGNTTVRLQGWFRVKWRA